MNHNEIRREKRKVTLHNFLSTITFLCGRTSWSSAYWPEKRFVSFANSIQSRVEFLKVENSFLSLISDAVL